MKLDIIEEHIDKARTIQYKFLGSTVYPQTIQAVALWCALLWFGTDCFTHIPQG